MIDFVNTLDLEAAIQLREALRRAMVAHNSGEDDASTSRELEKIAR